MTMARCMEGAPAHPSVAQRRWREGVIREACLHRRLPWSAWTAGHPGSTGGGRLQPDDRLTPGPANRRVRQELAASMRDHAEFERPTVAGPRSSSRGCSVNCRSRSQGSRCSRRWWLTGTRPRRWLTCRPMLTCWWSDHGAMGASASCRSGRSAMRWCCTRSARWSWSYPRGTRVGPHRRASILGQPLRHTVPISSSRLHSTSLSATGSTSRVSNASGLPGRPPPRPRRARLGDRDAGRASDGLHTAHRGGLLRIRAIG